MGPYLIEWNGGREVVSTWDAVLSHPRFEAASVFKRWLYGWVEV